MNAEVSGIEPAEKVEIIGTLARCQRDQPCLVVAPCIRHKLLDEEPDLAHVNGRLRSLGAGLGGPLRKPTIWWAFVLCQRTRRGHPQGLSASLSTRDQTCPTQTLRR